MKRVKQSPGHCGPACVESVLASMGYSFAQGEIRIRCPKDINPDGWIWTPNNLENVLKTLVGEKVGTVREPSSLAKLASLPGAHFAILFRQETPTRRHVVVYVRQIPEGIVVMDPDAGTDGDYVLWTQPMMDSWLKIESRYFLLRPAKPPAYAGYPYTVELG